MKQYINPKKSNSYSKKGVDIQRLINTALHILEKFGVPIDLTDRRLERMAMVFLACGDIKNIESIGSAKDLSHNYTNKTRDIIEYVNKYFNESISSGSYDDIRRKDLKLLLFANIVLQSSPNSATNDSTRGYALNPFYADLVKKYGSSDWEKIVKEKLSKIEPLKERLKRKRELIKVHVSLPTGKKLLFSSGEHNDLQKAVIEQFLPRYGAKAELLYVGDTANKYLFLEEEKLNNLNFFELSHNELPDIIAYSKENNWLYLIEAVHSSGAINELRLIQLKELTKDCIADIVYVTAFLDRNTFRKYISEIAWETEVWIADNPDHLIHFNGDKFLGPYKD